MKKGLFLLIIALGFMACNKYNYLMDSSCYKVYKIKLNNEYYEIYAKQGDRHYKIISKKEKVSGKKGVKKIKMGGCYHFELTSMRETAPVIDGIKLAPLNYLDIQYNYPENTTIKIDGGKITDLHHAKNLKGLYLLE